MDPARASVRELSALPTRSPEEGGRLRVGRDGFLGLRFARREDRTVLVSRRFRAPLQLLEPLDTAGDGSALAVLLNPGGGVLGGDRLQTEIDLGPNTHVTVATASATKVYRCPGPAAAQHTTVTVAEGAVLEYVPHHLIPHAGAALKQSLHIDLGPRSRLILYDGLSLGRVARGECWAFRSLASRVRIAEGDRPLYEDCFRLTADQAPALANLGGAEGCAYLGTILFCEAGRTGWEDVRGVTLELLRETQMQGGASLLARGGCVVRFLAPSAHALTAFARAAWGLGRRKLLGLPPLDLRLD